MSSNDDYSFEDFEIEQQAKWRLWIAKGGIIAFFVVNAILTGVYGLFAVLTTFPPGAQPTIELQAAVWAAAITFALILVVLLDGSRAIWHEASIMEETSGSQQALAQIVEVVMLVFTVAASVAALRVIFHLVGIAALTVVEQENAGKAMTWILGIALTIDMLAGWAFTFVSPKAKLMRSAAKRSALTLDTISRNADYQLEATKRKLPKALAADHPGIVSETVSKVRGIVNRTLRRGNDTPRQLPSMASSQPNEARGLRDRDAGEGGNGANP